MSTGFSDQHSTVEFTSQNLVDGARLELALHGCRPCVIPLYEPPTLINPTNKWGHRSESNRLKRVPQTRPAPFGFGHTWSWSSESNTRWRGTSSLHCHCARPANIWSWQAALNCGRALTMRLLFPLSYTSGAGAAIRSPQQAKIRLAGDPDSNAHHGLTRPTLFPLSYTSTNSGGGGENCTPDDLLCGQTPCCLGYATSNRQTFWSGVRGFEPVLPTSHPSTRKRTRALGTRTADPGYCLYTNSAFKMERTARVELASSGWRPEAPAAIPCSQWREMKDSNLRSWFWRPAS